MKTQSRYGIYAPHGTWDWEPDLLKRHETVALSGLAENDKRETVLVDARGRALLVRGPRPVGFREPR